MTLILGGQLRPHLIGADIPRSTLGKAVDLLPAKTAGGSLGRLGFCLGVLEAEPHLNKHGITIY